MKERGVASKSQLLWNSACLAFDVKVWRLRDVCRRCCSSVDDSNECWVTRASHAQSLRELRNQDTAPVRRLQKQRKKVGEERLMTGEDKHSPPGLSTTITTTLKLTTALHVKSSSLSRGSHCTSTSSQDARMPRSPTLTRRNHSHSRQTSWFHLHFRLRRHCLDGCLQVHDENNFPATNRRSSALTRA